MTDLRYVNCERWFFSSFCVVVVRYFIRLEFECCVLAALFPRWCLHDIELAHAADAIRCAAVFSFCLIPLLPSLRLVFFVWSLDSFFLTQFLDTKYIIIEASGCVASNGSSNGQYASFASKSSLIGWADDCYFNRFSFSRNKVDKKKKLLTFSEIQSKPRGRRNHSTKIIPHVLVRSRIFEYNSSSHRLNC